MDLGTANTRIYEKKKGIILDEPSIVAVQHGKRTSRVVAAGLQAKTMVGKAPSQIQIIHPIRQGVISEYDVFTAMLKCFLRKVSSRGVFIKPDILFVVPNRITVVEQRALIEAAEQVGVRKVKLIRSAVAAALGAGLPIEKPQCSMVVDMGAGKTEIAVISLADIVICKSVLSSGEAIDFSIAQHLKSKYKLIVGEQTAEMVKTGTGNVFFNPDESGSVIEIKGRDLQNGIPKVISIHARETAQMILDRLPPVIYEIKQTLEQIPPELASDVIDTGLVLTGGLSKIDGMEKAIGKEIGIPVMTAEEPLSAVILGAGKTLENGKVLEKVAVN
jgi:rod shape-determining protein MreB